MNMNAVEQRLADLTDALTDALAAIDDELTASGEDEIKQHPVLRMHKQIFDNGMKILQRRHESLL